MKSKITIDVDWDNQPIIKIEYNHSDDVRDTLVKRFLEAFGADSSWANFRYVETSPIAEANKTSIIRAISPPESQTNLDLMKVWCDHLKEQGVKMQTAE